MTTTKTRPEPVSYDAGIEHLRAYASKNTYRNSASLLMEEEGKFYIWDRDAEPCYGFLRTYGKDSTRSQDPKPSDLLNDFPTGTPVALAVPFLQILNYKGNEKFYDLIFSPEQSPWKEIFKDVEVMEDGSRYFGIVFKDTDVDSTVLINFLRTLRHLNNHTFDAIKAAHPELEDRFVLTASFFMGAGGFPTQFLGSPKWFHSGKYRDLTGGTFRNRYAYNRPEIDYLFKDDKEEKAFCKVAYDKFGQPRFNWNTNSYEPGQFTLDKTLELLKESLDAP